MDFFINQLKATSEIPFWMDDNIIKCLYIACKFENYHEIYNQCFQNSIEKTLLNSIEILKEKDYSGTFIHECNLWIPSFIEIISPIVIQCLDAVYCSPKSIWIPKNSDLNENENHNILNNYLERFCENHISKRFFHFCNECFCDYNNLENEEMSNKKEEEKMLTDYSILNNIDKAESFIKSEEEERRAQETKNNFFFVMKKLGITNNVIMYLLLYFIVHMEEEDYNNFNEYISFGIPIFDEQTIRKIENYRKNEIKDKGLIGKMDSSVLFFVFIFYKI